MPGRHTNMDSARGSRADDGPPKGGRTVLYGLLAAASAAGIVLVLLGTYRYGVGISPDSAGYLCTARNLLAGRGYWTLCGTLYSAWPPLFPTLLAAIGLAGIDPAIGARLLNAFAMGGIIFASGVFLGRCLRSRLLVVLGTGFVLFSFPLLGISSMAWTEPVFVLLIVLFILWMSAFLRDHSIPALAIATILATLCSLQRYTGVTLIAAGAILILAAGSGGNRRGRLKPLAGFLVVSCTPLGLWMVRNRWLTGTLSGNARQHSIYSIWDNLAATADMITQWIMPQGIPLAVRVGVFAGLAVLLTAVVLLLRRKGGWKSSDGREYVWTAGLVAAVYLPLILYTHQIGVLEETMNDRYLAPLAVLVPWLMFAGIDGLVALLRLFPRRGSVVAWILLAFCGVWLSYPLERTWATIRYQMRHGAGGYSTTEWQESPLARWLGSHPLRGAIRTNAPWVFYALTGVDAQVSPHRTWNIPAFQEMVSSGDGETLIWFTNSPASYLYDLDELVPMLPIEEIVSLPDGGVYRLVGSEGRASVPGGPFSTCMVNGVRYRRFTSDTFGPCGLIRSWLLRDDGTMDAIWELRLADGEMLTWSPSGECSRSGDTFEFQCEGRATRTSDGASAPYRLHVRGTIRGEVATGEYRIEFSGAQWPPSDKGSWRVDVARRVRRWYSSRREIHAYTMGREEVAALAGQSDASWLDEGVAFCVYSEGSQPPDVLPVFRFRSKASDAGFYTIDEAERDRAMSNPQVWEYRGIAWYAYSSQHPPAGAGAVHRFWSGPFRTHFYTMSESEKEKLLSGPPGSWTYEGVVWYALPADGS